MEIHIVWLGGSRMWVKPPNQKEGTIGAAAVVVVAALLEM